eukprot:322941_1
MSSINKTTTPVDSQRKQEILSRFKSLLVREMMRKNLSTIQEKKVDENTQLQSPFVRSPKDCIMKFIEMSKLTSNDILIDIGCGDGRLLIAAAKIAKCKCIGIEIQDKLVCQARQSIKDSDVAELVKIIKCDFKSIQCRHILKQATVIFMYLIPYIMPLITDILIKSLQNGCRVISYKYELGKIISQKSIQNIRITEWSYPSLGTTFVWMDNKIFMRNIHPDFENKYDINVDKLECCQLAKINGRDFEHVNNEYDFILAKRYIFDVVSNYYQFRKQESQHRLDMALKYRYKQELYGEEYDTFRERYKWSDTFEAVKANQIVDVVDKTDDSGTKCDLKMYIFPLAN